MWKGREYVVTSMRLEESGPVKAMLASVE